MLVFNIPHCFLFIPPFFEAVARLELKLLWQQLFPVYFQPGRCECELRSKDHVPCMLQNYLGITTPQASLCWNSTSSMHLSGNITYKDALMWWQLQL